MVTLKLNSGALNARDIASRTLDQLGLKSLRFTPTEIHTQNHLCPILGLCATGARLNIEIGIVLIDLTRKHAPKLKRFQNRFQVRYF